MLTNEPIISFVVGGATAIPAGARVKFDTNSVSSVVVAGHADQEIGTAILYSGKASYAVGESIGVKFLNAPGTRTLIASGAFAIGATLKRDDNGKVDDGAAGTNFAIALEAAAADGDLVEALCLPGVTTVAA